MLSETIKVTKYSVCSGKWEMGGEGNRGLMEQTLSNYSFKLCPCTSLILNNHGKGMVEYMMTWKVVLQGKEL